VHTSGEDELNGIVEGTAEALGLQSLGKDLCISLELSLHTDSAAAAGICRRSGIGRVLHLAVAPRVNTMQMWSQSPSI
jgi:hypothetical protein